MMEKGLIYHLYTEAVNAAAERVGIGRMVWKDGHLEDAPVMPPPKDLSRSCVRFDLEKDPSGFPLRQICFMKDDVEYNTKVYMRSRPSADIAFGEWELKRIVSLPI